MTSKLLCLLSFLVFFSYSSEAQNYGISFNGSTQIIDAGNNALFNANTLRTLECWVKFNDLGGSQEIISKSDIGSGIELLIFGGNLAFYCMNNITGSTSYLTYPAINLVTNRWYHIAATWNGTKESMRIYVNGIVVASVPNNIGDINVGGLSNPGNLRLGMWNGAARFLNGQLDEVRIWNVPRSQTEIKRGMYGVPSNTTGLVAYYRMNEGSGTTAVNATANGSALNGTLTNIPATPVDPPTYVIAPTAYSASGLQTDGVNDYAMTPGNAAWNLATGTVECWIRPTAFTAGVNHCVWGFRGGVPNNGTEFSIHVAGIVGGSGTAELGWYNGLYYTLPYTFNPGTWYHLAFVVGATNTTAYVNGVLLGTYPNGSGFGTATTPAMVIGRVKADAAEIEPYNGAVDELRVWNTMRTPTEINTYKDRSITGTEAGLVAHYNFNLGNPGSTNTGMTTVFDNSATSNHATLFNFDLTGTASNFITSNIVLLPVTYESFTATKQNGQGVLQWLTSAETNSSHFIVERSSDGAQYESIGQVAAAGNSNLKNTYAFTDRNPTNGVNFYRLKQVDLNSAVHYSIVKTLDFSNAARLQWYATGANAVDIRLDKGANETYQLVDLKGRVLKAGYLRNGRVQFSNLRPGTYIFRVKAAELMTQQFIVQ